MLNRPIECRSALQQSVCRFDHPKRLIRRHQIDSHLLTMTIDQWAKPKRMTHQPFQRHQCAGLFLNIHDLSTKKRIIDMNISAGCCSRNELD
jgi:hypothetical protein